MPNERRRCKFRRYQKEDARWPSLRITPDIPPDQIDYGFEFPVCESGLEIVRESFGEQITGGASCSKYSEEIWA